MKNPLYYIGKYLAHGIGKFLDALERFFAKGSKTAKWFDRFIVGCVCLMLGLNLLRAFIAAPIVTGSILLGIALIVGSLYVYFTHKDGEK